MTTSRGDIPAPVARFSATIHSDGTADPIDPSHANARDWATAAWIEQSAYPASPARAASYIYGHACHHHQCSFTHLSDAAVGDAITVTTSPSVLRYRVCASGLSPKTGNLVIPQCQPASVDLVLVTCAYEQGDTSTDNLIVVATLIGATNRRN
ncbi:MAG: sortase [Actinomycetota bacterium]|nr:sortase [Actinomycetota bacterium]